MGIEVKHSKKSLCSFGYGDLFICDNCNIIQESYSDFSECYNKPSKFDEDDEFSLTGCDYFLVKEIEDFKVIFF